MSRNTQQKLPQSIFPDFPRADNLVSLEGNSPGKLTPTWHLSLASLYQALQQNFSNEGIQLPQLTSNANSPQGDQIGFIQGLYTPYIGKVLPQNLPNIGGKKVWDYFASAEKTFILTFATPGDASSNITVAEWKTVTLT